MLHVTNGDSVVHTLGHSSLDGPAIGWRDVLHEGRVPPGDPATVRRARAEFLAGEGFETPEAILASLEAADAALMAALDAGHETVLWFEHDLHDQLQLIQILDRIADHPARDVTRLITLDRFPGHPRFAGLGELTADELGTLWPQRRPIPAEAFAVARRAYESFRRPDPDDLAALGGEEIPSLPYLAAAIRRLLEERPWVSGLSRTQRQILRAVAAGAQTRWDVFELTQQMEEARYTGDSWFFRRIEELAAGDPPLLTSTEAGFALTPAGHAALND